MTDIHHADAIRAHVQKLVRAWDADYWRNCDRERAFPREFFDAVGAAGYFGALLSEEHGGSAAGLATASVLVEEINRAGGDAAAVNAQMTICGVLARDGSAEQRKLLSDVAAGKL